MSRMLTTAAAMTALGLTSLGADAAVAAQAPPTSGRIVNYTHSKKTKSGRLEVKIRKAVVSFVVPDNIVCGEQRGESGDPISCTSLKRFKGDEVNLYFAKQHGKNVASWVSVVIKK